MADRTASDTRLHVDTAPPPFQISKDFPGSDNPIPLSPQWLLPKPGESTPGTGTVENHAMSNPSHGNRSETVKMSGNGEDASDGHKRKNIFRPSMLDSESGRRDSWRDEERDLKSSIRKDRWRDGDKDLGDTRRVDRWTENSSVRHYGEARRGASDRWNDAGNREANSEQRRESKWNTRWGPGDKEPEGLFEKWSDSGKDGNGDLHLNKGLSHISTPVKDDKEGDHYRPWRPNSLQNRGRVESVHHQNVTPNKQVPLFSSGRGRGDDTPPLFSLGRARLGSGGGSINSSSTYSEYTGTLLDQVESDHGEAYPFSYSRAKLLDVYKVTDMHADRKLVDDFVPVPNITQDDPLDPLALSAPDSEELSVLKGIDKGEIISSSAPQVAKDGRNSTEFTHSRLVKLGNRSHPDKSEYGGSYRVDEVAATRESTIEGNSSVHPGAGWRAMPPGGHDASTSLHDSRDVPGDDRSRSSDMSWSHHPQDPHSQWDSNLDYLSDTRDAAKWQGSKDLSVKSQLSGILDSEVETRRVPQPPPEELSLFYKDPQGRVQGPFKGIDIIGWFETGYFGIELPVRLENAAADSPWLQLGDAMPHLRAKARPLPGFPVTKLDHAEEPGSQNSSTFGNHAGLSGVEMLRTDSSHRQGSTEAENRFLESLMSGNKSSAPLDNLTFSEGLQRFAGNYSGNLAPSAVEGGNNLYLLAKRLALERQRSLPNPYTYWPGRDAAPLASKPDFVPDASPVSKLLSSVSDNSRQNQPQSSEMMSIIQGLSDKSSIGPSNGVPGWPGYPLQGGLDPLQNKIDLHHDRNFPQLPFGIQQQRLQAPNQLSLNNLIPQATDNPSNILTAEKLLSSGLSQDPQILNMLQQQYMLQLHSQTAASPQQMPLLEKLLLLKQQQQQEEQQQLLRQQQQREEQQQLLRQQQQQLLSQVLQEHHSLQRFGDLSFGQLQGGGIPMGNLHVDTSQLQPQQELFPMTSQTPAHSLHDELSTNSLNLPPQVSQDTSYNISSEASSQLPHQLFGNISHQKNQAPTLSEKINEKYQKEMLPKSASVESSLLDEHSSSKEVPNIVQKPPSDSGYTDKSNEQMPDNSYRAGDSVITKTSKSNEHSQPVHCVEPTLPTPLSASCGIELPLASEPGKNVEDVVIRSDSVVVKQAGKDCSNVEPSVVEKNVEAREPKKATEKKSKKQKSSKSQSSDQAKGLQKNTQAKKTEAEKSNYGKINLGGANKVEQNNQSRTSKAEATDHAEVTGLPANIPRSSTKTVVVDGDMKAGNDVAAPNIELTSGRAWKPAPGLRPKSLLEIQQEEQSKAQSDMFVSEITSSVNSMSLTTPWVGIVNNPDSVKVSSESHKEAGNSETLAKSETPHNSKSKKNPLHDVLVEEVKKSSERDAEIADSMPSSQNIAVHTAEFIDHGNFIEAKETKRNRKKSSKSKSSGAKVSIPVAPSEVPAGSSHIEKGKSSQMDKEQLPPIPAGPSLGDFVLWKGEPAATSPSPAPVWTTESVRVPKPTSLRDILEEQEKRASAVPTNQLPTPHKLPPTQAARSSGPSYASASALTKATPPIQINSQVSHSKYKGDDDLFWGPIDQSKHETKQSDFPQFASQGNSGTKNVPIKGNSPGLSRQKSGSGKMPEKSLSSSPVSSQSMLKLKKNTKNSEAMDFRVWCENECVRLIGTKDTSFLEFCLKQSRSEAKMFLVENLGSYDPDHQFIDKFLNYMELLPSDVLETAFQTRNDNKFTTSGGLISENADIEGFAKGGKKKSKKGKKISSAVLGFNVVSNRIMMGEIQTVED